jgi:hypothetical protein
MIETVQVRLGLIDPNKEVFNQETGDTVTGKDVIRQLTTNNVWRNSPKGKYVAVQYNSQTFKFFVGETMVLPESVAKALRRSSAILVGEDKLNGPIIPFLEVKETMEMAIANTSIHSATTCPVCHEEQKSLPALARHLMTHPEAQEADTAPAPTPKGVKKPKTDWEGDEDEA